MQTVVIDGLSFEKSIPLLIFSLLITICGIIGILGNLLLFAVMRERTLRNKSCNFLLSLLSIVDSLNIFCVLFDRISLYLDKPFLHNNLACKLWEYVSHVLMYTSAWIICLISIERITFMLRSQQGDRSSSSMKRVIIGTIMIWLLSALSQLYRLYFVDYNEKTRSCVFVKDDFIYGASLQTTLHICFAFVLPCICVGVCNGICVNLLHRYSKRYSNKAQQQQQQASAKTFGQSFTFCSNQNNNNNRAIETKPSSLSINNLNNPHPLHHPLHPRRRHHHSTKESPPLPPSHSTPIPTTTPTPPWTLYGSHIRVTRILIIITIVYVVCQLPRALSEAWMSYLLAQVKRVKTNKSALMEYSFKFHFYIVYMAPTSYLFFCLSYGLHSYVYVLLDKRFRQSSMLIAYRIVHFLTSGYFSCCFCCCCCCCYDCLWENNHHHHHHHHHHHQQQQLQNSHYPNGNAIDRGGGGHRRWHSDSDSSSFSVYDGGDICILFCQVSTNSIQQAENNDNNNNNNNNNNDNDNDNDNMVQPARHSLISIRNEAVD